MANTRAMMRNQLILNQLLMEIATSSHQLLSFVRSSSSWNAIRESADSVIGIIRAHRPRLLLEEHKGVVDEIDEVVQEMIKQRP